MASPLIEALRRIDPSRGFVDYVNHVKPYHSKILEVLEEYVWMDAIDVTVRESHHVNVEFLRPDVNVTFDAGWGFQWNAPDSSSSQMFRISSCTGGLGGTVVVDGDCRDRLLPATKMLVWINESAPSTAVYDIATVAYSSSTDRSTIRVVSSQNMLPPVNSQDHLHTIGFVFAPNVVRGSVETTNGLVVLNDRLGNPVEYADGQAITLFRRAPAPGSVPAVVPVANYFVQAKSHDMSIMQVIDRGVGEDFIVVHGDRRNALPAGRALRITDGVTISTTVVRATGLHYISASPAVFLNDPWYQELKLANVTLIPVTVEVSEDLLNCWLIPATEPTASEDAPIDRTHLTVKNDVTDVHGTKKFMLSGDRRAGYQVGRTYTMRPRSGWTTQYTVTVTSVDYVGDDTHPLYQSIGQSDITVVAGRHTSNLTQQLDNLSSGAIVTIPDGSTEYFITLGGFGWSQPSYSDTLPPECSWKRDVKAATLHNTRLIGSQVVDGALVDVGDRVLVKNQTDSQQNGVYTARSGDWTRLADDTHPGAAVRVVGGTANAFTNWVFKHPECEWIPYEFGERPELYADTYVSENLQIDILDTIQQE